MVMANVIPLFAIAVLLVLALIALLFRQKGWALFFVIIAAAIFFIFIF